MIESGTIQHAESQYVTTWRQTLGLTADALWALVKRAVVTGNKFQAFQNLNSGLRLVLMAFSHLAHKQDAIVMPQKTTTVDSLRWELLCAIGQVNRPRAFCTQDDLPLVMPGLEIDEVDAIRFPLGKIQPQRLIKPYSRINS